MGSLSGVHNITPLQNNLFFNNTTIKKVMMNSIIYSIVVYAKYELIQLSIVFQLSVMSFFFKNTFLKFRDSSNIIVRYIFSS